MRKKYLKAVRVSVLRERKRFKTRARQRGTGGLGFMLQKTWKGEFGPDIDVLEHIMYR